MYLYCCPVKPKQMSWEHQAGAFTRNSCLGLVASPTMDPGYCYSQFRDDEQGSFFRSAALSLVLPIHVLVRIKRPKLLYYHETS